MKAAIVEDELIIADHLTMLLESEGVEVIAVASDIEQAHKSLLENPDFYFLDIRLLNGESGLTFGAVLDQKNIPFIYITANSEADILKKAVATKPQHYITKPFKDRDVLAAIQILRIRLNKDSFILVQSAKGKEKVIIDEILFCRVDNIYVEIVTISKKILVRSTLAQIEEQLPNTFVKVHRSYLVNKGKIEMIKPNSLLVNNIEIPVSRTYKSALVL